MGIQQQLCEIHGRLDRAAQKAGRDPKEVSLLCVSKNFPKEAICEAAACGERLFGENRVDEFSIKHDNIKLSVDWHFIGQLQSNKVRKLIGKTSLIHSVDRPSLVKELQRRSLEAGVVTDILLQVDLQKKEGRGGAGTDAAKALLEEVSLCDALRLRGLMNVAPFGLSALDTERNFADVKGLFDGFSRELKSPCFDTLSMGMSGDFELAIAQGSTLVRIGSAIFGARNY
ncbi:MAG: YggS family pyridoxal phosphate-dependent enzyme [Clostridiales bacterium]|nr:YggS family pyridoxal phosphate-dependent enzyme [Clostridiales bacterium]